MWEEVQHGRRAECDRSGRRDPVRLHGGRLRLAHGIWWTTLVAGLALGALGMIPLWQHLLTVTPQPDPNLAPEMWQLTPEQAAGLGRLGLTLPAYAVLRLLATVAIMLTTIAMGLLIYRSRPDDGLALLLSFGLVTLGLAVNWAGMAALADWRPEAVMAGFFISALALPVLILVLFLFPDGRPVPRWAPGPVALGGAVILAWEVIFGDWAGPGGGAVADVLMLAGAAAQIYRYLRVSTVSQRVQTKWVLVGIAGGLVFGLGSHALATFFPDLAAPDTFVGLFLVPVGPYIGVAFIPVFLAIAVLRYRLWDIDVLIRRTLIYGLVTLLLTGVYFGGVAAMQAALRPLVGASSDLAVVASTLVVAALFLPLRRGVQRAIDRRFYRNKYNAERTLQAFAARLRHEVDLDALAGHLLGVVDATMQPAGIGIWVARPPVGREDHGLREDPQVPSDVRSRQTAAGTTGRGGTG